MAIVDSEGRLWGRFNVVDAVLAILLVGLLPLGYGAYALFRTPLPVLTGIEPATLTEGPNLRVTVRGANLSPFLRVSFGTVQGVNFLFADSTHAEVELNPMPPGVYDVVLYDQTQERVRLPKALTIIPAPTPFPTTRVVVVGRFTNLKHGEASQITAGMTLPFGIDVLEVGRPAPAEVKVYANGPLITLPVPDLVQVPVMLRMGCDVRAPNGYPGCHGASFPLNPTYIGPIATPLGDLSFQLDQLSGSQLSESVRVAVRFAAPPGLLAQIRPGDVDVGIAENELAAGATIMSLAPERRLSDDAAEQQVTFLVRSQRTAAGWTYVTTPLRVGSSFSFRAPRYELTGTVLSITPSGPEPGRRK